MIKNDLKTIDILRDFIFDGRDEDGVRISDVETALLKAISYGRESAQPEGGEILIGGLPVLRECPHCGGAIRLPTMNVCEEGKQADAAVGKE